MQVFKKEEYLENLLTNKRIVLVGPSKHLERKKIGKIINEYDVVCRVGELYPWKFENDYGNRTDIVFNCFNSYTPDQNNKEIERLDEKTKNKLLKEDLKCAICPQFSVDGSGIKTEDNFKKVKDFSENNIKFFNIEDDYFNFIKKYVGAPPTTGLMSMIYLLNFSIKELFITGFSFYAQGDLSSQCYKKGYCGTNNENNPTGHPRGPQMDFFEQFVFCYFKNLIILDSYLNELFELNHDKVVQL